MNTSRKTSFNIWRNSLVSQLLLRFWICQIIFFILIGFIQYSSLKSSLYQGVQQNLSSDFQSIRNNMTAWLGSNGLPPDRSAELRPGNFVAFYSNDSKLKFLVYSYGKTNRAILNFTEGNLAFNLNQKALSAQPFILESADKYKYMLLVQPIFSGQVSEILVLPSEGLDTIIGPKLLPIVGYAVIGEPLTDADLILQRNLRGYVYNAIFILLLSTLLTAYALQKPLLPLLNISSTARKIAGGQYNLRLPYMKTASEIEQLRDALNHMLGQLENALNTERTARDRMAQFIADASHELRTPLTSIRGFLEILKRSGTSDKETLDSAHQTMLIETERLIRLTEGLLTLNRIAQEDQGTDEKNTEAAFAEKRSTLQAVLPELLPLLSPLLKNRILRLNGNDICDIQDIPIQPSDNEVLPLKPDELKQILYNLLNNALQYTPPGGIIEIISEQRKTELSISVKDNGQGIPPEDLPHLFERFFRGDRSRSHHKGQGSGLGLAIVRELVYLRGGDIKVDSRLGEGTTFEITFPLKK